MWAGNTWSQPATLVDFWILPIIPHVCISWLNLGGFYHFFMIRLHVQSFGLYMYVLHAHTREVIYWKPKVTLPPEVTAQPKVVALWRSHKKRNSSAMWMEQPDCSTEQLENFLATMIFQLYLFTHAADQSMI